MRWVGLASGPLANVASMPLALSMAQTLFAIALGFMALLITGFALYVISTVVWADRWVRRPR